MKRNRIWIRRTQLILIFALCGLTVGLDFIEIKFVQDGLRNAFISKIIQSTFGCIAAILILILLKIKLFQKPTNLLYMIPCLIIAIDNFPFSSYIQEKMLLVHKEIADIILFILYCLLVALFEECVFRGILFSVLVYCFPKNRKGLLFAVIASSLVFGLLHAINGISIQIGYTILMGGLFAFCLIKTKNLLCCVSVHAIYNIGGSVFDIEKNLGLGKGVVFDKGTIITMLIISIPIAVFVIYKLWKYGEEERFILYKRLGIENGLGQKE